MFVIKQNYSARQTLRNDKLNYLRFGLKGERQLLKILDEMNDFKDRISNLK